MNYVTVSWLIMIIIMIIVDFTGKSHPFLDSEMTLQRIFIVIISKLINCYLYWMIYKGCWKFRISVWEAQLGGVAFDQAVSEGVMYRERRHCSEIFLLPGSLFGIQTWLSEKIDKKLCCYWNIAATVGRFSRVSVSWMRKEKWQNPSSSIFN